MPPPLTSWKPCEIHELQAHLDSFTGWILCGGHSIDLLVGRHTRDHGDIDIGVFRSQLTGCLEAIGPGRVFLCSPGGHIQWTGGDIDPAIHDIWISDSAQEHWIFQIMVYDDHGDTVTYRRDERITWQKSSHSIPSGEIRILNPAITLLYKSNKPPLAGKEAADITTLIKFFGEQGAE
ncbi:MAG: hypothetical protein WCD79_17040 [Chthoniobacteraceae bacterium]